MINALKGGTLFLIQTRLQSKFDEKVQFTQGSAGYRVRFSNDKG